MAGEERRGEPLVAAGARCEGPARQRHRGLLQPASSALWLAGPAPHHQPAQLQVRRLPLRRSAHLLQ